MWAKIHRHGSTRYTGSYNVLILILTLAFVSCTQEQPPILRTLDVPFSPQAPFADWDDERQQEGCEEMSVIMVKHYLEGTDLEKSQALEELLKFSEWQTSRGFGLDVTIAELASNVEDLYEYKTRLIHNPTAEDFKRELSLGNPLIVPAAGRMLGNPYFSGQGPWYHMLVVKGMTETEFITNDPGTKRGEGFRYRHDVLLNAIHDWTGVKEEIEEGKRVILIIEKP